MQNGKGMELKNQMTAVMETNIGLPLVARGKVRDIYAVGDDKLLIVTTDRLSAFDVVFSKPIPSKGAVLNQISLFWFEKFSDLIENHVLASDVNEMGIDFTADEKKLLAGRTILVKKAKPLPVECIVRGYITGSGWKDYQKTGSVSGHVLPKGLEKCQQLPAPIFSPSTKAVEGHDENITVDKARELVGADIADQIQKYAIEIYRRGAEFALSRDIVIADTKFEFGILDGKLILIDEVLTPDSSRFWPKSKYEIGREQDSFDKQIVRNFLEDSGWDKTPPAPVLPQEIIEKTSEAYVQIYELLSGKNL